MKRKQYCMICMLHLRYAYVIIIIIIINRRLLVKENISSLFAHDAGNELVNYFARRDVTTAYCVR